MRFLKRIEKIKSENEDKIVLARCGVFVIAVGNDARILSKEFGLKKICMKKGICKVGIPASYALKYLRLIEDKGYSYLLYDYDKDTKELVEKYRYTGINKLEEIELNCKLCENYKGEDLIDIFELLRIKEEEEKNKKQKEESEDKNE